MLIKDKAPFRVLLPEKLWKDTRDKEHFKKLLGDYMRTCYPNYIVKSVEEGFAVCERR